MRLAPSSRRRSRTAADGRPLVAIAVGLAAAAAAAILLATESDALRRRPPRASSLASSSRRKGGDDSSSQPSDGSGSNYYSPNNGFFPLPSLVRGDGGAAVPFLESSVFLHRGGSANGDDDGDDDDENNGSNDDAVIIESGEEEGDDDVDRKIQTEESDVRVTSEMMASSSNDQRNAEPTVETSAHAAPARKKKSNAVGDPDGNSSDDETSDADELDEHDEDAVEDMEELNGLEKELLLNELKKRRELRRRERKQHGTNTNHNGGGMGGGGGSSDELETLVEMARKREGMKRRIEEMEGELKRRRGENNADDGDAEDAEANEDETDTEQEEDEDDAIDDIDEGDIDDEEETGYHMSGTDVTKEDAVLKRQRKYKRGSIFKNSSSNAKKRNKSGTAAKSASAASATAESKPAAAPTNVDSRTLDSILIRAFRSVIYLPPPSPRLPSSEGSVSLRNIDVSSRRRLDRRTLYHGLLAELGGSHHHHHHHRVNKDSSSNSEDGSTKAAAATKKKDDKSVDSMIRRRYLDAHASRSLKGALSLACQPKWRERLLAKQPSISASSGKTLSKDGKGQTNVDDDEEEEEDTEEEAMPSWWYRGGVCLFPDEDDEAMMFQQPQQQQQPFMGQSNGMMGPPGTGGMGDQPPGQFSFGQPPDEEPGMAGGKSVTKPWRCTMSQQETVAMALAHSLSCGLALIDDEALEGVRKSVAEGLAQLATESVWEDVVVAKNGEEGAEDSSEEKPTIHPEELRNAALIGHLVRLSEEGKLGTCNIDGAKPEEGPGNIKSESRYGRISHRMAQDMELGLDDPNDDLAVESLRLMKEDERRWFEPIVAEDDDAETTTIDGEASSPAKEDGELLSKKENTQPKEEQQAPLSMVLFLRSDSSQSILRSKSAVETLAQECVRKDGIHLFVLGGKGIDASTTTLNVDDSNQGGGLGMAKGRMSKLQRYNLQRQNAMQGNNSQQQQQPPGGGSPFAFMSNFPPGSPEFNAQMMQQQQQNQQNPNGGGQFYGGFNPNQPPGTTFSAQNANASGLHDPDGSKRFNIFLARTVDPDGRPQILGTIAPPDAGNLFPVILRNMAKENLRKMDEQREEFGAEDDGEEEEGREAFRRQMEELASSAEAHMQQQQREEGADSTDDDAEASPDDLPNAVIFNATITSPFGAEIFNRMMQQQNEDGEDNGEEGGGYPMPPENVRKAIQDAMSGVIERLAQMSASAAASANNNGQGSTPLGGAGGIPLSIARAFSQVLSNENLRRGISENLSRAAPALVDPRCQGVMLSVYVPPDNNHPNRGMMPGDQYKNQQQQQQQQGSGRKGQQQQPPEAADKVSENIPQGMGGWLNKILSSSAEKGRQHSKEDEDEKEISSSAEEEKDSDDTREAEEGTTIQDKPIENKKESSSVEQQETAAASPTKPSSKSNKKSKREKSLDRARTLAVAAAALAGSAKNKRSSTKENNNNNPLGSNRTNRNAQQKKLTPSQKANRNLQRLQTLCRHVPLASPVDPVRQRSWESWSDRESGSVVFRRNKRALLAQLAARNLSLDVRSGTRGAGIVLRQMMSVRDMGGDGGEMEDVIRCAVEIEAGKSQRHHESPWGVVKPSATALVTKKSSPATDKSLVNFLGENNSESGTTTAVVKMQQTSSRSKTTTTQFIHPNSLESALSLVSGVSPSSGSQGSSSNAASGTPASHRSKEDLTALAQDKHERALIPNCVSPQDIGVTYDMIGGLSEVKELLRQSVTYPLKFPHLYSEGIAREAVKGVLLFGPPGTGKTMLAKAVATEGGASFLSVDASSVENKWLGESEKNAKAVFTLARRLAPCVIFIDEVDSLLSSREGSGDDSAHGTLTSVKTTMMSEWDGLNSGTNGRGDAGSDRVVVIGSTNRPFDLDEAVLRRFPRRILVDLPDLETRQEILEVTLAENRLGGDVNLTKVAERLDGYTGSDLKEVCREAVVQISHEQARMLDRGELFSDSEDDEDEDSNADVSGYSGGTGGFHALRPVTMQDFESAMQKLKRSVSETGRELAKVWDWNDEYGEIKKTSKRDVLPQMMNMFL